MKIAALLGVRALLLVFPHFLQKQSGLLGILEFVPPDVSGSIPYGANFGGLSPYRACYDFKRDPRKWAVGLVPSD
ncbi:hypothetical protein MTR_4g091250 [Medicago truncatula]|uniref:Transmembrane protein n=1 Tax=Medicago truncatula TaxID=3880 RepID=G7JRV4_MEDTR|nr:hypothetical protein MTR_4g091250 [Medicago truncatula]